MNLATLFLAKLYENSRKYKAVHVGNMMKSFLFLNSRFVSTAMAKVLFLNQIFKTNKNNFYHVRRQLLKLLFLILQNLLCVRMVKVVNIFNFSLCEGFEMSVENRYLLL